MVCLYDNCNKAIFSLETRVSCQKPAHHFIGCRRQSVKGNSSSVTPWKILHFALFLFRKWTSWQAEGYWIERLYVSLLRIEPSMLDSHLRRHIVSTWVSHWITFQEAHTQIKIFAEQKRTARLFHHSTIFHSTLKVAEKRALWIWL